MKRSARLHPAIRLSFASLAGLLVTLGAGTAASAAVPGGAQSNRPNIIYILFDDVGFADVGAYGSEIATPNIDALASAGLRYNYFDTRAICSPTRAALLTGRNNQSVGMMDLAANGGPQLPAHSQGSITPAAATVAQMLRTNGYRTSVVGKWHLTPPAHQADSSTNHSHWPSGKGFDQFYGFLTGWTDQFEPLLQGVGGRMNEGDRPITTLAPEGYHVSEAIVTRAIDYLKSDRAAGKPSFLYLSFGAGHAPVQVPKRYIDKYNGVYDKGWDRLREERFARQKQIGIVPANAVLPPRNQGDPAWDTLSEVQKKVFARYMAAYAGFIEHADEQIGRLLAHLKQSGQFDNTLIFFMSDNGAAPEAGVNGSFLRPYGGGLPIDDQLARLDELGGPTTGPLYQRPWAMAGNTPFKMYKLWPYAGGVRDPLIVHWPAVIRDAGAIRKQHVDVIDITPTVLDILDLKAPTEVDGVPQMPLHGASILRTFTDANAPSPRTRQFYLMRGHRYIIDGDWKAIAIHQNGTTFEADRWELYNVAEDFAESTDLAERFPEKVKELEALWSSEAEKYGGLPLTAGPGGGGARGGGRGGDGGPRGGAAGEEVAPRGAGG